MDTNLIETLVPPKSRGYDHQRTCEDVACTMKQFFSNDFALGFIDKDKKQLDYLKVFD